jgi:hypothetical protein
MSFGAWDLIWMFIGSVYGIMTLVWGIIVWRSRPWSLDLFQSSETPNAGPGAKSASLGRN